MEPLIIKWRRHPERIDFDKPYSIFVLGGTTGMGKSAQIEYFGDQYALHGHTVLDLNGSVDGEGCAQLRNPIFKNKRKLLLHGTDTKILAPDCDTKPYTDFDLNDLLEYDLIISSRPFYSSDDDHLRAIAEIPAAIMKRRNWTRLVYVLIREAGDLLASRLIAGDREQLAKFRVIRLMRQARHVGMVMATDAMRYTDVDVTIRSSAHYTIMKGMGNSVFPEELKYLLYFYNANEIRTMKPWVFIIASSTGGIGMGVCPYPQWHKTEKEDIISLMHIQISHNIDGTPVFDSPLQGKVKQVSDFEHVEIIRLYVSEHLASPAICERLGSKTDKTSRSTATITKQWNRHNEFVSATGSCPICKRCKGEYFSKVVSRGDARDPIPLDTPAPAAVL